MSNPINRFCSSTQMSRTVIRFVGKVHPTRSRARFKTPLYGVHAHLIFCGTIGTRSSVMGKR